jgi:cation transporter-like permease
MKSIETTDKASGIRRSSRGSVARAAAIVAATVAGPAHASFLSGEALDTAADYIAWAVLVLVPLIGITVFWIVHVLPEKFAHKRHHPQRDAIQVLCLLSLVFGGLLWPIAWLWAFTKPVSYKLAYGTEKHEDFFAEMGEKAQAGELAEHELGALKRELETMHARGALPPHLEKLRGDLESIDVAAAGFATAPGEPGGRAEPTVSVPEVARAGGR